jgi:tail protein
MADQAWQWVDAAGAATQLLEGTDVYVTPGVEGRFGPSIALSVVPVAQQPGQRFAQVLHGVAEVKAPLELYGASDSALRASVRTWAHRLDPVRGDGRLLITAPAGDQRELVCRYASGLDAAVEDETDLGHRLRAILRFTTEQPYWRDVSDTAAGPWSVGTAATFFPIFPLRLSASEVFADVTVVNAGDVEAWPVWTITGPGSDPVLRNLTTGMVLSLDTTLVGGETISVDTRPYTSAVPTGKTVTKNDGSSLFATLSATSSLWALIAGSNSVRIELSGATASSRVSLAFRQRYLTA